MKKTIVTLLAVFAVVFALHADQQSEAALKKVAKSFAGYGSYEVKFTVSAKGMGSMSGNYFVSGNKYRIKLQKQEHFSDGVNRYEVYTADKEIVIDDIDTDSRNLFNNPTRAFEFAPDEFYSKWLGEKEVNRVKANVVELTPRSDKYGGGVILLYLATATGMPVAVDYNYQGEEISIAIDKIIPLTSPDRSMFVFDPAQYGDYEVIDFR